MTRKEVLSEEQTVIGRPSAYRSEYCDQVVKCGAGGASLTGFAAEIGVSRRTLHNWAVANPEFAEACEIAKARACSWYEACLRTVAAGGGGPGSATAAIFGVKNYGTFDFQDRCQFDYVLHLQQPKITRAMTVLEAADLYRDKLR